MTDESGLSDQIRSILASGKTHTEVIKAIRRVVTPLPVVQHKVRLDDRKWPILCGSSASERDDPELS